MLEQWLEDAKSGEIVTVAIVGKRLGGEWQTGMSSSQNRLEDAAMLIELGMCVGLALTHRGNVCEKAYI
jgi:hypothetical protein